MPHPPLPYHHPDLSALARSLKRQLAEAPDKPGHLQLLNMLARATGHANHQHWRAEAEGKPKPSPTWAPKPKPEAQASECPPPKPSDAAPSKQAQAQNRLASQAARLLRHAFDAQGRLRHWPAKLSDQSLCMWGLWEALPPRGRHDESRINDCVKAMACFGDHVLLRRELVNHGLLGRTPDGRAYWKESPQAPEALAAFLAELRQRRQALAEA